MHEIKEPIQKERGFHRVAVDHSQAVMTDRSALSKYIGKAIIGAVCIAFAAVLIYILTRAGNYDLTGKGFIIYLVIPGALLLIYGLIFFLCSSALQNKLAMTSMCVVGMVFALEYFLPVIEERAAQARQPPDTLLKDKRDKRTVLADLKEQGIDAYPALYPRNFFSRGLNVGEDNLIPLAGVRSTHTVLCVRDSEDGNYVTYDSDEYGFRNPSGTHELDSINIVVLGDSFAQGVCVPCGHDIASSIRETYSGVLNLGYGGNGPLAYLATFREYGEQHKSKTVIWIHYEGNDMFNLLDEQITDLIKYLDPSHKLGHAAKQAMIDQALRDFVSGAINKTEKEAPLHGDIPDPPKSKVVTTLKLQNLRQRLGLVSGKPRSMDLFSKTLETARDAVRSWNGRFIVVYLPEHKRFQSMFYSDTARKHVLKALNLLDIETLDITSSFEEHTDPLSLFPYKASVHYTKKGYELVAMKILDYLEGKGSE